jgi:phage gpG-like protein
MGLDTKFVRGASKLKETLNRIQAELSLPIMKEEIGQFILRRTLVSFDHEEDPDGSPWQPNATSTLRRKRVGILNVTGTLRNSIQLIRGSNIGTLAVNTGAGIRIGISDPEQARIGRYQQFGTKNIPARRFLGIGAEDIKAVDNYLRRKGDKALNG